MLEDLTGLNKDQSDDFIRYIIASSCDEETGFQRGQGSAKFIEDEYVVEYSFNLRINDRTAFVILLIRLDSEGCLISIENRFQGKDEKFDSIFHEYLKSLYKKVLIQERKKFFKRTYYSVISGSNLLGEYWISNFRFAPLFPDDNSFHVNAERIFVIDQEVEAIDNNHANELARIRSEINTAILSFILDLGLDDPVHHERYFLEENPHRMIRKSTQLLDYNHPEKMPRKGEYCKHIEFEDSIFSTKGYAGEKLTCPIETRKIFKNLQEADEVIYSGFLNACRMYQLGLILGQRRQTVHIAYLYGAIDSIIQSNTKQYRSFSDFMTRYSNATKEMCKVIHGKIRSEHWHGGEFPLGELNNRGISIFDSSYIPITNIFVKSHRLIRTAILNWLNEKIDFNAGFEQQSKS